MINLHKILAENPKETEHLEDPVTGLRRGKMDQRNSVEGVGVWIGFIWVTMGAGVVRSSEHSKKISGFHKMQVTYLLAGRLLGSQERFCPMGSAVCCYSFHRHAGC
jgi:hypothetical protein